MIGRIFKNPFFLTGFLFIIVLLSTSLLFPSFIKPHLTAPPSLLYENGNLVDKPPYPPSTTYWFGVDRFGDDIFWKVIEGAKYTIFIALLVGVMRIILGFCGGLVYGFHHQRLKWIVEPFTRAFRFVPAVIIVIIYFIGGQENPGLWLIIKQCFILALIALLPLTSVIGEEIHYYLKNEFIDASRLLGGSKWWLAKKHISQFFRPKIFILLLQQVSQSLLLLVHLGVLNMFIGGVKMVNMGGLDGAKNVVSSLSNEWSGLIGLSYPELRFDHWIVIGPGIGFFLTLLSFNLMLRGIKKVLDERPVYAPQPLEITEQQPKTNTFKLANQSVQS